MPPQTSTVVSLDFVVATALICSATLIMFCSINSHFITGIKVESLLGDGVQQHLDLHFKVRSPVKLHLTHRSEGTDPAVRRVLPATGGLPYRLCPAVFPGLRPSRKPQRARLLPRRPPRLPPSRQGPQSRRRRSWAPTMRSKRTQQTTAKVRRRYARRPSEPSLPHPAPG